jgi:hypothetical protein
MTKKVVRDLAYRGIREVRRASIKDEWGRLGTRADYATEFI